MTDILRKRFTAELDGDYVVFLVGMRVNKPLKVWRWWPVFRSMVAMIRELYAKPDLGLLGHHVWPGRTVLVLQYWRSYEHLSSYASMRDEPHLPAWAKFNRTIGSSGDVGIWHETYLVGRGRYEAIYHNMPLFGLSKIGVVHDATGRRKSADGRVAGDDRARQSEPTA